MQHVYGHGGNLGNECADHAAALGTFGVTSSHNVATRWIHHNFDASVCFDGCNNISEVWNECSTVEQMQHHFLKIGVSVGFSHRVHRVPCAFHVLNSRVCLLLSACSLWVLASSNK